MKWLLAFLLAGAFPAAAQAPYEPIVVVDAAVCVSLTPARVVEIQRRAYERGRLVGFEQGKDAFAKEFRDAMEAENNRDRQERLRARK
jgi:hypothetical protein